MQRLSVRAVAFGLLFASSLAFGCRHASRDARGGASGQPMTAAAEARAEETTLTSADLETSGQSEDRDAAQQERRAHDESLAAFRLEQNDLQRKLQANLDGLDQGIARRREEGAGRSDPRLRELFERRALLATDLELLQRTNEADWAVVRPKIERDVVAARGTQLTPPP